MSWTDEIRITAVDVRLRPDRSWSLPPAPTVMARGALGRAMMELACVRSHRDCHQCDRNARCLIPGWFDPGRKDTASLRPVYPELRVRSGPEVSPEDTLGFRWWILGELPRPSLLLEAIIRMAAVGLGGERIEHVVERIRVHGEGEPVDVVCDGAQQSVWPEPGRLSQFLRQLHRPVGVTIRVQTPIQWQGARPGVPPSSMAVVKAAIDRVRRVARAQNVQIDRWWLGPSHINGEWIAPRWIQASRYSRRQDATVDISGWVGTVEIGTEAAAIQDLLAAVEVLHLGRNLSTGAGRVSLQWHQTSPRPAS